MVRREGQSWGWQAKDTGNEIMKDTFCWALGCFSVKEGISVFFRRQHIQGFAQINAPFKIYKTLSVQFYDITVS